MRLIAFSILVLGSLVAGCPTVDEGPDEPAPTPPPTDDDDDVETWLYTGEVWGTEDPVDVYVGEDQTTTFGDGSWSLRSSAGPEARVDVIHDGTDAWSRATCEREGHRAFFYDYEAPPPGPAAELAIAVRGVTDEAPVYGVFIAVDASRTFRDYLLPEDLIQDGDVHRIDRTVEAGSVWRLHLWARGEDGLTSDVILDGAGLAEGDVLEEEVELGPRIYQQLTLIGDPPADAETLQISERLSFGDVAYTAWIYAASPQVPGSIPRMDASGSVTAYYLLPETPECDSHWMAHGLAPVAGEVVLPDVLAVPVITPVAGEWTTRPDVDLVLSADAESGSVSINGGDAASWYLSVLPGCYEDQQTWPSALSDLDPAIETWARATARRGDSTSSCSKTIFSPED